MSDGSIAAAHDVLIVGGGAAGLRAAIAIAEVDPRLDIAVVSKVYPMRSHTVSAEGGAAGVIAEGDTLDEHAYDTVSGSDWLGDQDAIEAFVEEAPRELLQLEHWGCPWSRQEDGHIAVRAFGGMKRMRTWFAADKTGFHMLHALFQTSLKYTDITRYDEGFVTRLLVDEGRVHGVVAISSPTARSTPSLPRLSCWPPGAAARSSRSPPTPTSTPVTAWRSPIAPVHLKDMEFVQYHPTGLPFTGILITEATRAEGGWLLNKDGYRYLQDYDLGTPTPTPRLRSVELGPRDRLSQAFVHEVEKGRTLDSPYGPIVHLDLRHLGAKVIDTRLPFVRELCLKYERIDPVTQLIPVRPVVHYMMGGVHTDIDGATPIEGLFAAGETACVSINGANRLGSNSLPECLVFGARAGRAAAEHASRVGGPPSVITRQAADEGRRIERDLLGKESATEQVAVLREQMQSTMEESAGIYRNGPSISKGGDALAELQQRMAGVGVADTSRSFNTELAAALELANMLDIAESMLASALRREESRGAHQRTDCPDRDDERFLTHQLVHRGRDGAPRIERMPVTITRWPPGERVYGRQST